MMAYKMTFCQTPADGGTTTYDQTGMTYNVPLSPTQTYDHYGDNVSTTTT